MPSQPEVNAAPVDNSKVDPKNQQLFDMFILNGMEIIYDEKQAKSMLPRLGTGKDPIKSMAELLVDLIMRIVTSAKKAGKKIPPGVILHGGNFLFGELIKVLEAAGMEPMTEEQKTSVWQMASSIYLDRAIKSGDMTEHELVALSKQVEQSEEGKKVLATAKNPEAAVANLNPTQTTEAPAVQQEPSADAAIATPKQGGM